MNVGSNRINLVVGNDIGYWNIMEESFWFAK